MTPPHSYYIVISALQTHRQQNRFRAVSFNIRTCLSVYNFKGKNDIVSVYTSGFFHNILLYKMLNALVHRLKNIERNKTGVQTTQIMLFFFFDF